MPEQKIPMAELNTEDAALLGDMSLIVLELRSVIDTCRKLVIELERDQTDGVLVDALWTAALVKYVRCFASGKRFGLKADVLTGMEGDSAGVHQYFKDMRDKHIAHSLNPFEEVRVSVLLTPEAGGQAQAVGGIAVLSRKLICTNVEGVRTLMAITSALHKRVASRAKEMQDRLLEWAKSQPPEVFAKGPLGLNTPGSDAVAKARPR